MKFFWLNFQLPYACRHSGVCCTSGWPIPVEKRGVPAIEETTFEGVPVNVTLLFSQKQYVRSAEAYMRGIERRIAAGRDPGVHSVASVFISRWDKAIMGKVPDALRNRLGIAIAKRTYRSYRELLNSERWKALAQVGAPLQRLLWGSTGTKDPSAPDTMYVEALAAPDTIDTIPDKTLLAFADHGQVRGVMPVDGGDAESVLQEFARVGVNDSALAEELQREGAAAFSKSWNDLLECIASKSEALKKVSRSARHPMTQVERLSDFVASASFSDISGFAVNELKTRILDSLGCAIGALGNDLLHLLKEHVDDFGGRGTSTLIGAVPPTRSNSRSWRTRRSFACASAGISPISSRKIVPPWASSKRPMRRAMAPRTRSLAMRAITGWMVGPASTR